MKDSIFLKSLAILLIVNSHCDYYYPLRSLGTGGAIGNSVFFMLSAFGLYLSDRKQSRSFSEWYARRVGRVYPAVWVVLILLFFPIEFASGRLDLNNILGIFGNFFYPPYWFIQALMVIYFLLFPLIRNYTDRKFFFYAAATAGLYFIAYFGCLDLSVFMIEELPFKVVFYFGVCLFGVWLARRNDTIRYAGTSDFFWLFLCLAVMYGHKYFMTKQLFSSWQFVQQLILFPALYFLLKIARSKTVSVKLFRVPWFSRTVEWISNLTLEIYIVHLTISPVILSMKMAFPLNVIVFLVLTFVLSRVVRILADKVFSKNPLFAG
jgi:hypothetical protein